MSAMAEKPPRQAVANHRINRHQIPEPTLVLAPAPRRALHAFYLGARTIVIGPGGISIHRHTRGSVDRSAAVIGYGRQRPLGRS